MFDNSLTGAVGFAMHEDQLRRAAANLRIIEAEQATKRNPVRERVAKALIVLASKLMPGTAPRTQVT